MTLLTHRRWLLCASAAAFPTFSSAQVISYGPVTSVPTLGEWGAMMLVALVAVAGVAMARRMGSKALAVLACCAVAVFSAGSGSWLGKAYAVAAEYMSSDTGGTIDLSGYGSGYDIRIYGHPTKPMQILTVTPPSAPTTLTPTCTTGLIIPAAPVGAPGAAPSDYAGGVCYYRKDSGGT